MPVERIVVRPNPHKSGTYVVVEGNRRAAALKWISEDHDSGVSIDPEVLKILNGVPVVIVPEEGDELAYKALMGIRHVSGINQWGGYQRAKLVVEMKDEFKLDSGEVAERLALTVHEVNRRYRAFRALQQMRENEEFGDFADSDLYPIFHEAVSLPAVKAWLDWDDETFKFSSDPETEQFYALLSPSQDEPETGEEPKSRDAKITTYLQVRQLREILAKPEAKLMLLDPDRSFTDALALAEPAGNTDRWITDVTAATASINRISAPAIKTMTADQLSTIQKLLDAATELLSNHEKLKKMGPAQQVSLLRCERVSVCPRASRTHICFGYHTNS